MYPKSNLTKTKTEAKLVQEDSEKKLQLKPTQLKETLTRENVQKPKQTEKLFQIFEKTIEKPTPLTTITKKKDPKTDRKTKLDPKLAPSIKSFFMKKQTDQSESTPSACARTVDCYNPGLPGNLAYTCTQPQNGGKKHVNLETT